MIFNLVSILIFLIFNSVESLDFPEKKNNMFSKGKVNFLIKNYHAIRMDIYKNGYLKSNF